MEANEQAEILKKISPYVDLKFYPFGKQENGVCEIIKRESMYNGKGVVYMISTIQSGELVNNRFAQYMVLLNKGDEGGFHDHGSKKEQELYVIVHGKGKYTERRGENEIIKEIEVQKGNITAIQGIGNYHSIINTGDEPLIIFVVATNEKP